MAPFFVIRILYPSNLEMRSSTKVTWFAGAATF